MGKLYETVQVRHFDEEKEDNDGVNLQRLSDLQGIPEDASNSRPMEESGNTKSVGKEGSFLEIVPEDPTVSNAKIERPLEPEPTLERETLRED